MQRLEEEDGDELILMENTLRWQYNSQMMPESNARIVRWSNGSFSLMVGEEFFDVQTTNIADRFQFLNQGPRSFVIFHLQGGEQLV